MKLIFEAKRGTRIKSEFTGYTSNDNGWWFNGKAWQRFESKKQLSSHAPCFSVKAFRRKLKKAPKGVSFTLCSRYVGHNVIGVGNG